MAFQCSGVDQRSRPTSYGSASVSSAEAGSEAGTDHSHQMEDSQATQISEAADADAEVGGGGCHDKAQSACRQESHEDSPEACRSSEHSPPAPVFPNLPEQLLRDLQETPSDQDIENRFTAISIAFKTDKLTLEDRVTLQKRWRDQAELNMVHEENNLRSAIQNLYYLCKDSTSIEMVTKVKEQVDILKWAVEWLARSSESVGAIEQESRVSKAMEVMLQYVENLKRIQEKQDEEGKKRLKNQSEDLTDTEDSLTRTVRYRPFNNLPGVTKSTSKRRASIAAIPRPPGNYPEVSRASICVSPSYLDGSSRSLSLPRSGSFPRRTSFSPSLPPSSPSSTTWSSSDNLDTFDTNNFMDNIEEINESRRESCSSRTEPDDPALEENNNFSLKQPEDEVDKNLGEEKQTVAYPSYFQKLYLIYEDYSQTVEQAKEAVMDHLDTANLMHTARRAAAFLLVLAALYYLVAMFFEPAAASGVCSSSQASLH